MILTGPEIRRQVQLGGEWDGKERQVTLPSRGRDMGNGVRVVHGVHRFKNIVDCRMNYIDIDPYEPELVGPNSIDLRLGTDLVAYGWEIRPDYPGVVNGRRSNGVRWEPPSMDEPLDMRGENNTVHLKIPEEGLILQPGILYLGRTIETMGSNSFVPIVEGRSSVGRLGIHVHVTAGFCDLGFRGTITLEIHVIHPVRIYPNIPICQAYFLRPEGEIELYKGRYQNQVEPTPSRFGMKVENEDE